MKVTFILCLVVILIATLIYFLFFRMKKSLKTNILFGFLVCIIAITILVYPLLDYDNAYTRAFASFIYATKCIGMSQNLDVLAKISLKSIFGWTYFALINFFFLALPCLTAGMIMSFIDKIVTYIKLRYYKNKKIFVFSELNDKSLIVAKNLERDSLIIFANVNEKKDIGIKSIKTNKKVTNLELHSKSDITFYMISNNEDNNLTDTLELINKYKNRDKTKIYVVNQKDEASTILDSTDKGKIFLEIINEKERHVFSLLNNKPLFLNAFNKTISILIVGCGDIGKEFLKDAIWCGIIPNYQLKFLVVDIDANKIKDKINIQMPELLNNYDISFINGDIESTNVIERIKDSNDINYILVSMENDDKNINTAIMLRRLFLREFNSNPIINLYISNEYKREQISSLLNEKGDSYNFNAFGDIKDIYGKYHENGSELERLATKVHLIYDPSDKDLARYNLREYNKRSSRATALHLKYKLFTVLGDKYTDDMSKNLDLFREAYSSKIEDLLVRNEHDRWMAYMRSIGYIYVSTSDVTKYYKKTNNYINYLARMHPALVPYDKLDKVSKELEKITSKKINLKENDEVIIKSIKNIKL